MGFKLFNERRLNEYLSKREKTLFAQIDGLPEDQLLGVAAHDLAEELVRGHTVEVLSVAVDNAELVDKGTTTLVPSRLTPSGKLRVGEYTLEIPFTGDPYTLECQPNTRVLWSKRAYTLGSLVCIDLLGPEEEIGSQIEEIRRVVPQQVRNVAMQVESFNQRLLPAARGRLAHRAKTIVEKREKLGKLGLPIKRRGEVPKTFQVPAPRRKVVVSAPAASSGVMPHAALGMDVYADLLGVIGDVARQLERLPSTYAGKDEEALRDFLLLFLETIFEGSATGETFNRRGKTDILLRHNGENVFIAECKFWGGAKKHTAAIDQLLSYLTWRDTKTALIVFAKQKKVSEVVAKAIEGLLAHGCFVSEAKGLCKGWETYRFHLPGDQGIFAYVSLIVIHFPEP